MQDVSRPSLLDPPNYLQNGLILSGGGARAAYQVGVLMGIAEQLVPRHTNPFPIVCGTSAGAINAAGIAAYSNDFRLAVAKLEEAWRQITPSQVFHTNMGAFLKELLLWLLPTFLTASTPNNSALLNNRPLRLMLENLIPFQNIQQRIADKHLRALAITASSYTSSESVTFYQGVTGLPPWRRARRRGEPTRIGVEHLMASSSLPILFPAYQVGHDYYGDGAMRQQYPLSPALHLGADRILVVGVSGEGEQATARQVAGPYPSMAQILGHVLDSVFVDTLEGDVERLERVNQAIHAAPTDEPLLGMREIEVLKIYPSESIDDIAAEFLHLLPWRLRLFLRGTGGTRRSGAAAVSYLLFEPRFTEALIDLGLSDARRQQAQICRFLQPMCDLVTPESKRAC